MNKKPMSFRSAAKELLKRAGEPMTAKELTAQAIKEGLIAPEGKTPEATMAAQLNRDIKRDPGTSFKKVGKNRFALRLQSPREYLRTEINELDRMLGFEPVYCNAPELRGICDMGATAPPPTGSIPLGDIVLIRGEPGSGKTTLAMQILNTFLGAQPAQDPTPARVGAVISLEENPRNLISRLELSHAFALNRQKTCWLDESSEQRDSTLVCASAASTHDLIQRLATVGAGKGKSVNAIVKEVQSVVGEGVDVLASANPVVGAIKLATLLAGIPERAHEIRKRLEEITAAKGKHRVGQQRQCLLVVDSLNAFLNIAREHFPAARHPRVVLNAFCRCLKELFGPRATLILTSEYHYDSVAGSGSVSESFFCDVEIALRPEPVRVPAAYQPSIQAPVGYNLNALIDENARSIESRSFCRVTKSRSTANQSRRCAYDIVSHQGVRFYPTYPGDGKLVLFAENGPQREAWQNFFKYDIPESYPALRTAVFDRMSLQNVFEGQRRLQSAPLRTDMHLASFDSYWVSWYRNHKLRIEVEQWLHPLQKKKLSGEYRRRYPRLVNSIVRLLHQKSRGSVTTWMDVADHMSLSYFGPAIKEMFDDDTWKRWIDAQNQEREEADDQRLGVDGCCEIAGRPEFRKAGSFLDGVDRLREVAPHTSFLAPLPLEHLRLFGETRSKIIGELPDRRSGPLSSACHDAPGSSSGTGESARSCIPYDANVGFFVCRRDFLEHADLEQDEALVLLQGITEREMSLYSVSLVRLKAEMQIDIANRRLLVHEKELDGSLTTGEQGSGEDACVGVARAYARWVFECGSAAAFPDLSTDELSLLRELTQATADAMLQGTGIAPGTSTDAKVERTIRDTRKVLDCAKRLAKDACVLPFVMPASDGRRDYRFRVYPKKVSKLIKDLQEAINTPGDKQRKDALRECLDPDYPLDQESRETTLTDLCGAVEEDDIQHWLLMRMELLAHRTNAEKEKDKFVEENRSDVAELLEAACRIHELRCHLGSLVPGEMSDEQKKCIGMMTRSAAKRIASKQLPKTWEELIVTARMLDRPVQIEWQTFDSFVCCFLEVFWSCGGSSLAVEEDYRIRMAPRTGRDSSPGSTSEPDNSNLWYMGFVQMLKACHIMHELYWQKVAPRSTVSTHKPRAFHRGVAGSQDWVFARHWYSTFVELLTAKNEAGDLLYPDDPSMRLEIMQIPVSLTAWADNLQTHRDGKTWESVRDCGSSFGCCEDVDTHEERGRDTQDVQGRVSYPPTSPKCRSGRTDCPGCRRPLNYSCWGEWSFGLVSGSENTELAIDLVNNMMSSIKVLHRAFSGACVPTVEEFYDMYGDLPLVSIPERTEETLPKTTYSDFRRVFFGHAKSRQEIYDFRHCGKILHARLEQIRKARKKMDPARLIRFCTDVFCDIHGLYSAAILLREPFLNDPGATQE